MELDTDGDDIDDDDDDTTMSTPTSSEAFDKAFRSHLPHSTCHAPIAFLLAFSF